MLILCNIFVQLEHIILFNNFEKYHNFNYYRININLMVHRQLHVMLQVLHIIFNQLFHRGQNSNQLKKNESE